MINNLFFELIQVSVGTRTNLSRIPTELEWYKLYDIAKKQSLLGVCFAGIKIILSKSSLLDKKKLNFPEDLYLTWVAICVNIQRRNIVVNKECIVLQAKMAEEGIKTSILKGQGIAQLYNSNLTFLRQSGDIDIYTDCSIEKSVIFARAIHKQIEWDYKHFLLKIYPDTVVEIHHIPELLMNLFTNRKLKKWYDDPLVRKSIFTTNGDFITPSFDFNIVYILLHSYHHFLLGGIGMRQLMDYYFVLRAQKYDSAFMSKEHVLERITDFGMLKFTKGIMWIMRNVFILPKEYMVCTPEEEVGRIILEQVMLGGNFGYYDPRLRSKNIVNKKVETVKRLVKHSIHLYPHFTSELLWAPVYILYNKILKLRNSLL